MEQETQPSQVPEPPKAPSPQEQAQEPPKTLPQAPLPQAQAHAPLEQTPLQLSLQPQQTDLNVQRLEMLIAMFKSRNMELLEENNRLR